LLGKYGIVGTFEKYLGFKPIVTNTPINNKQYPENDFVVYRSTGEQPIGFDGSYYVPSKIAIIIPKCELKNDQIIKTVENLVGSIFYTIDHLTTWTNFNDEISQLYLGKIILPEENSIAKIKERVKEHYNSLDNYLDIHSKKKLHSLGIDVETYYDLMFLVNKMFNEWTIINSKSIGLQMETKVYEVLQYILYPITENVIRTTQELKKDEARGILTETKAAGTIRRYLRKGAMFELNKQKIYAQIVSYPGDHKYPAISSIVGLQQDADGDRVSKTKKKTLGDKDKLNFSMVEAGSLFAIKKSNHNPIYTINPYIQLDPLTMTLIPRDKFNAIREDIDNVLKGSLNNFGSDITEVLDIDNDTGDDIENDDDTDDDDNDYSQNDD
jgi:hypothetical protein